MLPESKTTRYESFDRPLIEQNIKQLCPKCTVLYQNADQDSGKQQSQAGGIVSSAKGGNIEAARRAGINVAWVRMSVFSLCSMFAVLGGVLLASRTFSASQSTGGSETLLPSIAGAVIGGVSLFGAAGRRTAEPDSTSVYSG